MRSFIISTLVFCLSLPSFAAQSLSTRLTESYSSMRALGMGGAFTAVADDYSLLYYNPSGLARKPYNEVQLTLLGAGVSSKTLTIANDIKKASDAGTTDTQKAQNISDVLDKYYGQSLGGKLEALEFFWVRKNWGFGIVPMDLTIDMTINRQLGPALDLNITGDSSAVLGYGTNVSKSLDVGITGKFTHRVAVQQSLSALELASDPNVLSSDRFKEGNNTDFDIGFMWTPDWFAKKSEPAPAPAPTTSTSTAPEAKTEVKSEDIKPEVKADVPAAKPDETTPSPADQAKKDETKPGDAKAADQKPADVDVKKDETKPEEPRAPQSEGDAQVVKTDDAKPADTKPADAKPDAAAPATPADAKTEDVPKPAVDTTKPADMNVDAKKDEAAKPEDVKADAKKEETPAPAPAPTPAPEAAGVVKLGDAKAEPVKTGPELNQGAGYPLNFGLTVHNVMAGGFTLSKMVNKTATQTPDKLERTIDVGSQYRLYDGEDLKIRAMLDFHDLLHPDITVAKSTHIGAEFDYSPSSWFKTQFRAGMNQMYFTAGATFLFGIFNFDLVTYGEEVGTDSNKIENRVNAAKISFNF